MSALRVFSRPPQRLRQTFNRAVLAALIVFLLSLTLLAYTDGWYAEQLLLEQQETTRDEVRAQGQALTMVFNNYLSRLQGLANFIPVIEGESALPVDLETFATDFNLTLPAIRYMAVAPDGVVRHLVSTDGGQALLDQNLLAHPAPEVRASVEEAVGTDDAVLAGPLTLADGRLGLIATRAVFRDDAYWGLLQIALDLEILFDDPAVRPPSAPLELALADAQGRVFLGPYTLFARNPVVYDIPVAEERWTLAGIPPGGWQAAIRSELLWARAGGLLIAILLSAVVYLTVDRQGRLAAAVARRTRELAEAQQLLEQRVEERTHELQTLLDVSRNVASTLDFPSLLSLLMEQVQEVVAFSGLAVYLIRDEDRLELEQVHGQRHTDKQLRPLLSGDLLNLRAPLIISDASSGSAEDEQWRVVMGDLPSPSALQRGSWMAVPLLLKNRLLGLMIFEHSVTGAYTQRHGQLAMAVANHVAVAIENARLYEQAHSLAAMQERQKLARELHDSVSQALYGIGLGTHTALSLMEQSVTDAQARELRPPLEYTLSLARAAQAEMRALIFELRPESLEVEGLLPALGRATEALQARYEIQVHAAFAAEPEITLEAKEILYRVAQEALHNIAKHAEATQVDLSLTDSAGDILLEIRDDGIGFDPQGHFPGHLGLQSMRERVEGIGGDLSVNSRPGAGTVIQARIPPS